MTAPRTYATSLVTHPDEGWRARRARQRALRRLENTARQQESAAATEKHRTEAARRRNDRWLPRGGETGPTALRSWRPFRVPSHAATSAVLCGAYPFLAEGGLGDNGQLVGTDLLSGGAFTYDPWALYRAGLLTNPNVLVAGVIGTGKSALAKSLTTRSLAFGARVYVPGDPKGEWTAVAAAVGGTAIVLGPGLAARLNPLDPGVRPNGLSDAEWTALVWSRRRELLGVLAETVLTRPLRPVEHTALDTALHRAVATGATPTLPAVVSALLEPVHDNNEAQALQADGRDVAHALRRMVHGDLAGMFDGESTLRLDASAPMVTLDLSRITGNDTLLSLVMTCGSAWMEAALLDPDAGRRWIVYDEAWRIMRQPSLIRRMQGQWKLSRAYGIANMMIVHRLSDLNAVGDAHSEARALAQGLLADCSTRIIYRQETDQLATSEAALRLTDTERDLLPTLGLGQGLWRVRDRAFVVQHQMTQGELRLFDTTARMRNGGNA